jgi:hypothetical protein
MELKAEYKRETYRNYIIFYNQENDIQEGKQKERYEIPMLLNNRIPYFLEVQITYLNERARYAYDITGSQTVFDWVERKKIKYKDCVNLYNSIFGVIDACTEYLLNESNIVILPEYIFYELSNNKYNFVYYIYYHRDILQQINELSEFLMDHVDYEDEKAVLLVYAMYHESKRREASIDTLRTAFQEKKRLKENEGTKSGEVVVTSRDCTEISNNLIGESNYHIEKVDNPINKIESEINLNNGIKLNKKTENQKVTNIPKRKQLVQRPIMEERQESEKLISKFPVQSYTVVGITVFVMLIVIVYSIGQGLELKKLVAVILIVASITAYIGSKMFDPKKKVEKMVPVVEYIKQPKSNSLSYIGNTLDYAKECSMENNFEKSNKNSTEKDGNNEVYIKEELRTKTEFNVMEDLYESTQLLSIVEERDSEEEKVENKESPNDNTLSMQYVLLPQEDKYKPLTVLEFPFYIGKITDGMDAVIMESTISRIHAKITQEDENFYITDMGSTNGTFINEENIQPHSRKQIKIGDILRFANVTYTFAGV